MNCCMFPCREDHIITLKLSGLGASDRLILLPFGMVVEPSSFEAWLLIALDLNVRGFQQFTQFFD